MSNLSINILKLLVLFSSIVLMACNNTRHSILERTGIEANDNHQQKKHRNEFLIIPGKRFGPLSLNSIAPNDLLKAFGIQNVKRAKIYMGEGIYDQGYLVFPDSANQVEIVYDNTVSDKPILIRVQNELTDWHTSDGITIGTNLEDLVKINGAPISFLGFGWDYSGSVMDFNSGRISNKLKLFLDFTVEKIPEKLIGDRELKSDTLGEYIKHIKVSVINLEL